MRRLVAAVFLLPLGCGPADAPSSLPSLADDGCAGDLDPVGGECVLLEHLMRVLVFHAPDGGFVSTCTYTQQDGDPGIAQGVVATSGACAVYDEREFGPVNVAPAATEPGVTLSHGDVAVAIDEGPLFAGCLERKTLPPDFLEAGRTFAVQFDGNATFPAFRGDLPLPADPRFQRSALEPGRDLLFTWDAVVADIVTASVSEGPIQVYCEAPSAAGRLTIPAELMELVPTPDAPGEEPLVSIRARNAERLLFPEADAVVALTADTYTSLF